MPTFWRQLRFEPPSREEVHSTCGTHTHISFESRTCTGWNLVRILKYLEISLRDSSVNCTILHRDWSLLNVLCPCARFIMVYLCLSIFMSVKLGGLCRFGGLCRCHLGAFLQGALADDSEIGPTVETDCRNAFPYRSAAGQVDS